MDDRAFLCITNSFLLTLFCKMSIYILPYVIYFRVSCLGYNNSESKYTLSQSISKNIIIFSVYIEMSAMSINTM